MRASRRSTRWRAGILNDYCIHGTREGDDGKRYLKCVPEDEALIYRERGPLSTASAISGAAAIRCILCSASVPIRRASFWLIAWRAPQRQITIVPNAGHFLPMEEPDYVAQAAVKFLQALTLTTHGRTRAFRGTDWIRTAPRPIRLPPRSPPRRSSIPCFASFLGWALDAFDFFVLVFVLPVGRA